MKTYPIHSPAIENNAVYDEMKTYREQKLSPVFVVFAQLNVISPNYVNL